MAVKHVRVKNKHAWVKWVVALCVLLFLGAVFGASVGVGNWLLRKAEQYPAGEQQTEAVVPEQERLPVRVPPVKAHAYVLGERYSSYTYAGITQLCAPLRADDGAVLFASQVCERTAWDQNGSVQLDDHVKDLHTAGLYLCTYIPVRGFEEQDAALRELTLSYEAALIAEAAACGVDEIFLTGLAPTQANIAEVVQYLQRVKALAGDTAIGVLITPEVLLAAQYNVYTAAQLMRVCDFLVLDLRDLPLDDAAIESEDMGVEADTLDAESQTDADVQKNGVSIKYVLEQMQYDLQRYSPRLALGEQQTDALDYVLSRGYDNWVVME